MNFNSERMPRKKSVKTLRWRTAATVKKNSKKEISQKHFEKHACELWRKKKNQSFKNHVSFKELEILDKCNFETLGICVVYHTQVLL